jgi:hypothetical protein
MSATTLNTSLGLGAVARPGVCDSGLVLGTTLPASPATGVFTPAPAARIAAIQANQAWMRMWHLEPAYSVKHTDRPIPRPLERSP